MAVATLGAGLGGCTPATPIAAPAAVDFDAGYVCILTGLRPFDHPAPKGQIHYQGSDRPVYFCDASELINTLLAETRPQRILAVHVQDAGHTDWYEPRGHWIDARSAIYVAGSTRIGPLGVTLVPFSDDTLARAFISEHGGTRLRFADITPNDVVLDGGALHDSRM